MIFKAKDTSTGVRGRSIIDHRIRIKAGVTCQEYCILDFIYALTSKKKVKYMPSEHDELIFKSTGYYPHALTKVMDQLVKKGLLHVDKDGYMTTLLWDDFFAKDLNTEFELLWSDYKKIGTKIGNKKSAFDMFCRARKEVTEEHLKTRLELYKKYIEITGTFNMHCSSWLNPKYKKFDDEYENSIKEQNVMETGKFSI